MTDEILELGLLDDEEIELDLAALFLSALDHEGMDLEPFHDLLDDIQASLEIAGDGADTLERQAAALVEVFSREFGFTGDPEAYGAPVNADLIRVLERRRGLPVSLAILYVAAARRMGWPAYALNSPGHVLVRLGDEHFVLIDPFNDGALVSRPQFEAMVRMFMGQDAQVLPEYLAPVPNRAVLVRLLRNQAMRAVQAGDADRAMTVHLRMTQIAPEYPDVWWDLARQQLQVRDRDGARRSLSAMLEVTREPQQRASIVDALNKLSTGNGSRNES